MSGREFWAARGRQQDGPHDSREAAEAAGAAKWGEKLFQVGYGNGGAWFDLRGVGRVPLFQARRRRAQTA